jgi:hypothetical protein
VEDKSPSALTKDLEGQVRLILRPVDTFKLSRQLRDQLIELKQTLSQARVYAVDYELSETREEQLSNAVGAQELLAKARANILSASEFDLFSAPDVAHLTAVVDQVIAKLK